MNIFLTEIGYFGAYIILTLLVIKIYNSHKYINTIYIIIFVMACITEISNHALKKVFKQPRPAGIDYINTWDTFKPGSYGMPSGHMQNTTTGGSFLFLFTKNTALRTYILLQTFITGYQRWYYKKHTIQQILAGATIGTVSGTLYYYLFKQYDKFLLKPPATTVAPAAPATTVAPAAPSPAA